VRVCECVRACALFYMFCALSLCFILFVCFVLRVLCELCVRASELLFLLLCVELLTVERSSCYLVQRKHHSQIDWVSPPYDHDKS
jgi:hypothetical protein